LFVTGSPNAFGLNSPLGTLFGTNGVADASSGVLDSNDSGEPSNGVIRV
jgi:hypothetical protein